MLYKSIIKTTTHQFSLTTIIGRLNIYTHEDLEMQMKHLKRWKNNFIFKIKNPKSRITSENLGTLWEHTLILLYILRVRRNPMNPVISMAERRGLEPRHLSASPDFKSGSLANSDISPFLAHLKFYYKNLALSRYIKNSFDFFIL